MPTWISGPPTTRGGGTCERRRRQHPLAPCGWASGCSAGSQRSRRQPVAEARGEQEVHSPGQRGFVQRRSFTADPRRGRLAATGSCARARREASSALARSSEEEKLLVSLDRRYCALSVWRPYGSASTLPRWAASRSTWPVRCAQRFRARGRPPVTRSRSRSMSSRSMSSRSRPSRSTSSLGRPRSCARGACFATTSRHAGAVGEEPLVSSPQARQRSGHRQLAGRSCALARLHDRSRNHDDRHHISGSNSGRAGRVLATESSS